MLGIIKTFGIVGVGFLNLVLGLIVLLQNPKKNINRVFFFLSASFSIWAFALYLYEFPWIFSSNFWIHVTYSVVILIVTFFFAFSFIFPFTNFRKAWLSAIVAGFVYLFFSAYLLFFTDSWVIDVVIRSGQKPHTVLGPGYLYWSSFGMALFIWSTINFLVKGKKSQGHQKTQISLFWVGFSLFAACSVIFDVLIPIIWKNTDYFYISVYGNLFFSLSVAYAILKHRLLDIRPIIARSVTYLFLLLMLGVLYTGGLFLVSAYIANETMSTSTLITSTFWALIMIFSFQSLRQFLEKVTNNIFYKEQYFPDELIYKLSTKMAENIQLDIMTREVLEILKDEMGISIASFLVTTRGEEFEYTTKDHNKFHSRPTSEELRLISEGNKTLIFENLEEGKVKDIFRKHGLLVFIPLMTKERRVGYLLLGEKSSGDNYYEKDIKTLKTLAPQFAVVIQNARSYEEVLHFNETLKGEVDKATSNIRAANKRLRELGQLKDEFFSIAAHELRTPLTAIQGNIALIQQYGGNCIKENKEMAEILDDVSKSSKRLIKIVNDYLDASRLEQGRVIFKEEAVDVKEIIIKVIGEVKEMLSEKGLSIELCDELKEATPPQVLGDKDRIEQVIYNLVGNAIKYTKKGGLKIRVEKEDEFLHIKFEDTGIGIAEDQRQLLFQKFQQVGEKSLDRKTSRGTGIGLYISKLLAEAMGGTLFLEKSEIGKGSTFAFSIPIAKVAKRA